MTFEGVIPAITTPFDDRLNLDTAALSRNLDSLLAAGVHGVAGAGTMGESGSLTRAERRELLEATVHAVNGRVPVLAGISATSQAAAIDYASDAKSAGVQGLMVLPPLLYNGSYTDLVSFFRAICAVSDLPVVAYNNPQAAGYDLSPRTLIKLASDVSDVVQVKECSGEIRRTPAILNDSAEKLGILVGEDDLAFEGLCSGAAGWISGVANVLPAQCVELLELIQRGDLSSARKLYGRILPMCRLDLVPKLVQFYKAGMDAVDMGMFGGPARPPRLPLSRDELAELDDALASALESAPSV